MGSAASATTVDINSDMGEGYGPYAMGRDGEILRIVTSANVACGFHAGDPEIMAATFREARKNGVAVGAHPGFPDLLGFGRRHIPFSAGEIERLVAYQIGAAQALAAYAGHRLSYVKAHGALGNLTETDPEVALAVTRAIRAVDPTLICLTIARGAQTRLAQEAGLTVKSEIFADRAYDDEGHLLSRKIAGAVIQDADQAAQRVLRMVSRGAIETLSGKSLATPVDSVCVHGDTPSAVMIAERVRAALEKAGMKVQPFVGSAADQLSGGSDIG